MTKTDFEYVRGQGFVISPSSAAPQREQFFFDIEHAAERACISVRHFNRIAALAFVEPLKFEGALGVGERSAFYTPADIKAVIEYRRTHPSGVRLSRRLRGTPPTLHAEHTLSAAAVNTRKDKDVSKAITSISSEQNQAGACSAGARQDLLREI